MRTDSGEHARVVLAPGVANANIIEAKHVELSDLVVMGRARAVEKTTSGQQLPLEMTKSYEPRVYGGGDNDASCW